MKNISLFSFTVLFLAAITFSSCSDDTSTNETGPIKLEFDNVVGTANLQMNTANTPYTNSKTQAYKVTWLTYYVSNIKLKRDDGTIFEDPIKSDGSAGFYLVDETDNDSQEITLENVPVGNYTEVTFTIGVDATQVSQGAQTGALDPALGLFWSWNSGYIGLALEGVSPASTQASNAFQFHVGGYKKDAASNQVNNVRTITLPFNGDTAPVRAQHEPEVHLVFDVNKFLNGSGEQIDFTGSSARHTPASCERLADNIPGAFVVDHVHAN